MFNFLRRKKTKKDATFEEDLKGIIGRYYEDDNAVIVKYVSEIPNENITLKLPWFTVVSWKYDGGNNNGMPIKATNAKMIELESALASAFESNEICKHTYNRTGNNLKEFNYYIAERDEFMRQFNHTLRNHEKYPIEISFYKDREWTEFKKLIENFK